VMQTHGTIAPVVLNPGMVEELSEVAAGAPSVSTENRPILKGDLRISLSDLRRDRYACSASI
jgi:hypothetical protein